MTGGKTGILPIMRFARPGKTVGLDFDMDCNDVTETTEDGHRPAAEGFASLHNGCIHACGHDGYVTVVTWALRRLMRTP